MIGTASNTYQSLLRIDSPYNKTYEGGFKKDMKNILSFIITLGLVFAVVACSIGPATVEDSSDRAVVNYTEDFTKCTATGTSYVTGSFAGNNWTWYYTKTAWSGADITGKTPVLGKGQVPTSQLKVTVSNGLGTISFKYKKAYSTNVSLNLKINGVVKKTFTATVTGTIMTGTYTANVAGSTVIEFIQSSSTAGQCSIDTITWSSYDGTTSSSAVVSSSVASSSVASSVASSVSSVASSSGTTFTENMALSQAIRDYYRSAYGKSGTALKTALVSIISAGYVNLGYSGLWTTYLTSDVTPAGKIWDLYSNTDNNGTGSTAMYWFTPTTSQCGTYSVEGNCYNREHMIPQSTFAEASPMVADAHFITATDGKVNGMRSNYPHGNVATATWTSKNGGKLGSGTSAQGYTGTCFEPRADTKGDVARCYLYFSIRYYGNSSCAAWAAMGSGGKLLTWSQTLYKAWAIADPVSSKEITRNNAIYARQKNRNPFVDYPSLVNLINFTL